MGSTAGSYCTLLNWTYLLQLLHSAPDLLLPALIHDQHLDAVLLYTLQLPHLTDRGVRGARGLELA